MKRWVIILLAAPVVLWSAYWGGAAFFLKNETKALLRNQLPGQLSAQISQTQVRGYPTNFQLHLADVTVQDTGMFAWTSPGIQINAPSYGPQNIRMDIIGPQQIRSKLGDLAMTADDFQVTLLVNPVLELSLGLAQLDLENARLVHDEGWQILLGRLMISVKDTLTSGTYDMDAAASALGLSGILPKLPPAYDEIEALRASMGIEFTRDWDFGMVEAGPPFLRTLTIREAEVMFGESLIAIEGELGLTAQNRVSGALTLDITGWRELLSVLRDAGYVDPDIADLIEEFMGDQTQSDQIELPLVIQSGRVRFGVFTLGTVPALP